MSRPTTLSGWSRRDKILAAFLAAVGAFGALAQVLGWGDAVSAAALAIATVGAVGRLLIAIAVGRLERSREQAEFEERLRAPIGPARTIPCTRIGIDPAAAEFLPGGTEPDYLPRAIDRELRNVLTRALAGTGGSTGASDGWLVVLCGPSKVGKSRTLYEALRGLEGERWDLALIAPRDGEALRWLSPKELKPRSRRRRPVLWLDDIETLVAEQVTIETLRQWHEQTGAIVVGTFGGKGSERIHPDRATELTSLADSLLMHAEKIGLGVTTPAELARLPAELSATDREKIDRYGLAAALVAADLLQQRFMSERQALAEPASPVGKAVVWAAIDWARCGRADPIPEAQLRRLWPAYLEPKGASAGTDAFEAGLEWALRPVAGQVSLLIRREGYEAYDYAVLLGSECDPSPPKDEAWECALKTDDPEQILAVGVTAAQHGLDERARRAMETVVERTEEEIASTALFNLGVLADRRHDLDAAEHAWRRAAEIGSGDAAFNLALLLAERDDPEASIAAYRRAVELEHEGGTLNLAALLGRNGEKDEAIAVLRSGIENGSGKCANNLGFLLKDDGRTDEAREAFRTAMEIGDPLGAHNLGVELMEEGETAEAIAMFRRGIALGGGQTARELGLYLLNEGNEGEALEAFGEAMELNDGEGAFEYGRLLFKRGDHPGAVAAFRRGKELGEPHATVAFGIHQRELREFAAARESFEAVLDSDDAKAAAAARAELAALKALETLPADPGQEGV
jgi:tetratricopeptide (TPR) repeat protein